jgi:hypothetical protein
VSDVDVVDKLVVVSTDVVDSLRPAIAGDDNDRSA